MDQRMPRICVFAPSPILTVTVEAPTDNGEDEIHIHAGGQGYWVARMAAVLGAHVCLCASIGGETGSLLGGLLSDAGLELSATPVSGSNAAYIHDRRGGERVTIAETVAASFSRHEVDDLYNSTIAESLNAGVVILTGPGQNASLPPEIYARLSRDLASNEVITVADLSGDELSALEGVDVLKVSDEDLVRDDQVAGRNPAELEVVMRDLTRAHAKNVVVSRAADPAIALVDGELVEILPPRFEPVDHHGAGDSMTAALAVGLASGMSMRESLQLAAAAGALNVTRHGLGSGRRDSIRKLASHVEIRPVTTA